MHKAGKLPPLGADYDEVGTIFDTFYRAIEGIVTTKNENNNHKDDDGEEEDVDYESRGDESGSDYSESIEEEEDDASESDYDEEEKRRRKRDLSRKFPNENASALRRFYSSIFSGEKEREESHNQNHNYSRKHVEGRVSGKVELLNKRLRREIASPQLPTKLFNHSHANGSNFDAITSRSIPGDFFDMFSSMFPSTKRDAPITLFSSGAIKKKYNNHQLWRIYASKKSVVEYLDELRMSSEGKKIHWLESPRLHSFTDVVVAPELLESFKGFLSKGNINFSVKLRNIQNAIRYENLRLNRKEQIEAEIINGHPLTFYHYHTSKDILAYYDFIKRKYPSFVELITLGFTFNSKPLVMVKVSAPKQVNVSVSASHKPGVFLLAGLSAHLWLPVASSLYILDNIVTNIASNDSFGEYIRKHDWYILSLLNVDGYDYSMAFDRLWRKTRSEYANNDSGGGLILSP